jgi:hypothetical protein
MIWRWAAASAIGTGHISAGTRLQDAYAVEALNEDAVFAIVCDGAGSAQCGAEGAWVVCRHFKVRFRDWFKGQSAMPSNEILHGWLDEVRYTLEQAATVRNLTQRDFACTLMLLAASGEEFVAMQIGDSSLVGQTGSQWDVICWPQNGEYASSTYFVTDDPEPRPEIVRASNGYSAFALFSDGVGDLALSHLDQAAHEKFFNPMMRPVERIAVGGRLVELSGQLKQYLASEKVNAKTDDDKTLILLSRS